MVIILYLNISYYNYLKKGHGEIYLPFDHHRIFRIDQYL